MNEKVYVTLDKNLVIQSVHYMPFDSVHGLRKTEEELLKTGLLLDMPTPSSELDILYYDAESNSLAYKPGEPIKFLTPEQRIEQLEQQLIAQQEQFRLELAESNTQMFEMMMTMQGGIV